MSATRHENLLATLISCIQPDRAPAVKLSTRLTAEQDRVERQTSVTPSSSRPTPADKASTELTEPWTSALTATLQHGIHTARQSQMNQQLPVLRSKHGSRVCSSLLSDAWAVGTRCCHDRLWSQAAMGSEEDVQQMSTAKRLSLLTIKAHECTVQYEQIVSTGMLAQSSSSPPSSMWAADFHAAVTAAYLSLKPSMHSIMCQAMMERSPSSHLGSRPSLDTPTAADATADNATLLVHSQSEQVVMAASEGARQKHSTRVGSVRPLGRIKVAWGEAPKLNSVAPLPLPGSGSSSSMQSSSLDAGTSRLQDCSATGKRTTGTAAALDSGLEELWWHQGMLQRWPAALCSAYALATLLTATEMLQSLRLVSASPNTTMQQLCQSLGNAAHLMDLASSAHPTSAQMLQVEEDCMDQELAEHGASCQALGASVLSQLSSSIAELHLQAVDAVVLAAVDHNPWQSSRKPLTWPDSPGHAVRLWRLMLLSLRQALTHNCPAAIAQGVLGSSLQPAAQRITAKYSKLQPAGPWQARLAADVWHVVETCQMMTQPIEAAGSLQDMSPDIVTAVSSLCEQLCVDFSLQKLHPQAKGGEGLWGGLHPEPA